MSGPVKVFFTGEHTDFIVFVESEDALQKFKKDSSIPLVDVVSIYKVFTTSSSRGSEGKLDEASKSQLSNEFGSSNVDEAIVKIVKEGSVRASANVATKRYTSTNDSFGPAT
ncbi:hypothetical protein PACTADRAFT_79232 [Pachysolen tannophilus NRRL Y-2460]|uniref:Ribosome maturation protein SDO1/SBDS N-terminal domain-containing protein n=1 Tax=Pachysolen tannophilus NRRL Y-2460 TaxID=669874 RepID=A0A1E4TYI9_PACTA|nr:hypothetical protein PACTADRAFT_79232 [Pachysolen tannophilus NRRL Y-2460]